MRWRQGVRLGAVLSAGLFGCDERVEPELGPCPGNYFEKVELSETTRLGFSAETVLANLAGAHTSVLTWLPSTPRYARAGRSSIITVEVEPRGGAHDSRYCDVQSVQIDAVLHLSTGDGALDERLDARLEAFDEGAAWTRVALERAALKGTFETASPPPDEALELIVYVSRSGSGGMLKSGSPLAEPLAFWTEPDICANSSARGAAALEQANAFVAIMPWQGSNPVSYADGASGQIDYSLELTDGCVGVTGARIFNSSQFQGKLSLRSDDGRIDGAFPVEVYLLSDTTLNAQIFPISWVLQAYAGTTERNGFETLVHSLGVRDVLDVSAYDALAVEASGHLSKFDSGRRILRVDGLSGGQCSRETSSGRAVCEGTESTTLFRAQF